MIRRVAGIGLAVLGVTILVGLTACQTSTTPGLVGNATAGATDFTNLCSGCHTAAALKPFAGNIISNLGTLNPAMNGITLTAQQIADIQAYLATV
jgi:hypothetical protein